MPKDDILIKPVREQILEMAGLLFYREGIRAIGVDRLIREANIAKATLYRHFPSKAFLVEAYLQDRHERVIASLEEVIARGTTPYTQIGLLFDQLHEKADSPEFRGCAFALAVGEHGESERVVAIAQAHKAAVRAVLRRITDPLGESADDVAGHLALLYEGALATTAVERDPAVILRARKCALFLIEAAPTRKRCLPDEAHQL